MFFDKRVWFNGRTSAFQADDAGSIPATRSKEYGVLKLLLLGLGEFYSLLFRDLVHTHCFAHIAQQVEHFLGKEEVIGSNPIVSTTVRVMGY